MFKHTRKIKKKIWLAHHPNAMAFITSYECDDNMMNFYNAFKPAIFEKFSPVYGKVLPKMIITDMNFGNNVVKISWHSLCNSNSHKSLLN